MFVEATCYQVETLVFPDSYEILYWQYVLIPNQYVRNLLPVNFGESVETGLRHYFSRISDKKKKQKKIDR